MDKLEEDMKKRNECIQEVYKELDRETLQNAQIIAATTSAAAKNNSLLQSSGSKIIICEEAGEVLEAHIHESTEG